MGDCIGDDFGDKGAFWADVGTDGPAFLLDNDRQTREWEVTAEVTLPREAFEVEFYSWIAFQVELDDDYLEHNPPEIALYDCDDAQLLDQGLVSATEAYFVYDIFLDCEPDILCTRAVCMEATNSEDGAPVMLNWFVHVQLDVPAENQSVQSVEVPVSIGFEELIP